MCPANNNEIVRMIKGEPKNRRNTFRAMIAMALAGILIMDIGQRMPRYADGMSLVAYAKMAWAQYPVKK